MRARLRLSQAGDYLRRGDVIGLLRKPIYSEDIGIGLRRDLSAGPDPRLATIERELRPAAAADIQALLDPVDANPGDAQDQDDRRVEGRVAAALGTRGCYVADSDEGQPGFMQYVFTSDDNELFQSLYSHTGPVLAPDEAMVEFLYVAPGARTMSFIIECMTLVIEEARQRGASSVVTFPGADKQGALMVSQFVGLQPYAIRRSRYRFFRKTTTFEPHSDPMSMVS